MAGAVLTTLPVIAAYIYLQKYWWKGSPRARLKADGNLTDLRTPSRGQWRAPATSRLPGIDAEPQGKGASRDSAASRSAGEEAAHPDAHHLPPVSRAHEVGDGSASADAASAASRSDAIGQLLLPHPARRRLARIGVGAAPASAILTSPTRLAASRTRSAPLRSGLSSASAAEFT